MAKARRESLGLWWAWIGAAVVVGLTICQLILIKYSESWAGLPSNLFGDSFGALNAVISGFAFVGFIITLIMQGRQLKLQRAELEDTRKELSGARRAQETQVQMGLQSSRVAAVAAILSQRAHLYDVTANQPQRQALLTEINRWTAELEAEITIMHYVGQPWLAANSMLHQAAVELQNGQIANPPISFPLNMPNDLPQGLAAASTSVDALLEQSFQVNSARQGHHFTDQNDPLKPVIRAWLFRAGECLRLAIQHAEEDVEEAEQ
jgi:hypothetical protein